MRMVLGLCSTVVRKATKCKLLPEISYLKLQRLLVTKIKI